MRALSASARQVTPRPLRATKAISQPANDSGRARRSVIAIWCVTELDMNQLFPLAHAAASGPYRPSSPSALGSPRAPKSLRACDLPLLRPPAYSRFTAFNSGRMPTRRECRPFRPRPQPRWSASRRGRSKDRPAGLDAHAHPDPQLKLIELQVATDLGPVRINFRYNNTFSTSADFCEKSHRQQFCEEAHEIAWHRWAVVNPYCTDVQFQPIKAIFEDAAGNQICVYWDIGLEFYDGSIVFGEIKADESFFLDTKAALIANVSAQALNAYGIAFVRLHGSDFDTITRETIKEIFDYRRTQFDTQRDLEPILEAIVRTGHPLSFGNAIELIGGHPSEAKAKLCAMMVKRYVALDLAHPLSQETSVSLAPEAKDPGALRRFLAACLPPIDVKT